MNQKIICKIYELKGIIKTLSELANEDEQYNYPMIEMLEANMNEVVNMIENDV